MEVETQVNNQTLLPGAELEDFTITSVLGQGGFGITYKARDVKLERDVAVKEYLPSQFAYRNPAGQVAPRTDSDKELFEWGLSRFLDEARTLARFRHPNIVSVMRFFEANGTAYLVMEFEEGADLEHWLADHPTPEEPHLVNNIIGPILRGLALVHDAGLLHRDIKPDNIFIRQDGTPVLIDFGAARPHGPEAASRLTSIISAGYSPFEQYGTGDRQGPWSDLYALAGTLYRVVCGNPPTDAIARQQGQALEPAVTAAASGYSRPFLETLDQALSLEIDERPQDARAFLNALGLPADSRSSQVSAVAPVKKSSGGRYLMMLSVLVLIAGTAYVAWQNGWLAGEPPAEPQTEESDASQTGPGEADPEVDPDQDRAEEPDEGEPEQEPSTDVELSEDTLLDGLALPDQLRSYRLDQISGALLAYTSTKTRFDDCREVQCSDLPDLIQRMSVTLEPQPWQREAASGVVQVVNPRRLDSEACPFMVDIRETVSFGGESRSELRTYCTSNGFDRVLQSVQPGAG